MDDESIEEILEEHYRDDFHYESGRVLGSMYTNPPDIVLKAFFKFYQANLGNPQLYPGTARMERKVVEFLLKLTSGDENFFGHVVSGGTEANITALWAARKMGFSRILATKDVHFSILKASDILKLPLDYVEMEKFTMSVKDLEEKVTDRDIIVATAGTTPTGYVDPVKDISRICEEVGCYLHVDAAFGGFVIPFLERKIPFGFENPGVMSITIDPHKMGMAPYPAGGLVSRENIFREVEFSAPYLGGGKNVGILGTRQSGSVAASYAAILHFGMEGYAEVVRKCMENTKYLERRAREEGFEILAEPVMNIINVVVDDLERVKREMWNRRWAISTNPKYSSIRIVVMPHITKNVVDEFLKDLGEII